MILPVLTLILGAGRQRDKRYRSAGCALRPAIFPC